MCLDNTGLYVENNLSTKHTKSTKSTKSTKNLTSCFFVDFVDEKSMRDYYCFFTFTATSCANPATFSVNLPPAAVGVVVVVVPVAVLNHVT